MNLMDNILDLHQELKNKTYKHGAYYAFNISDPKPRSIHKALVRDRLLHHALYRQLYPFFDNIFIADSYSCRENKGTHKAIGRFKEFCRQASFGQTKTLHILKCDIRKFFASIDQAVLVRILDEYIADKDIVDLLREIIGSFSAVREGVGLPLGNLTSQLLVNIYMNRFDQFVKHRLKAKYYIRYADDFVVISQDKKWLEEVLKEMGIFLKTELRLELHPDKVYVKTLASGVDFLGWVHFPYHRVLRTATRRKMFRRLAETDKEETRQSYLGMLSHGNAKKLASKINEKLVI